MAYTHPNFRAKKQLLAARKKLMPTQPPVAPGPRPERALADKRAQAVGGVAPLPRLDAERSDKRDQLRAMIQKNKGYKEARLDRIMPSGFKREDGELKHPNWARGRRQARRFRRSQPGARTFGGQPYGSKSIDV